MHPMYCIFHPGITMEEGLASATGVKLDDPHGERERSTWFSDAPILIAIFAVAPITPDPEIDKRLILESRPTEQIKHFPGYSWTDYVG